MPTRTRLVLAVILFLQLVLGVMYAVRTPPWQAPDEPAHLNYVRALAETASFPVLQMGDYDQQYLEQIKARKFPPDLSIEPIRYEAHQPPLYYLLATPLYLIARALHLDLVITLRLLNVALALALSLIAFRVFRHVFDGAPVAATGVVPTNPNSVLPLVAVGIIATLPMHIAMSAAINNDTLAEVVVALLLYLAILRVQDSVNARRFFVFGGILYGTALLTKTTIYPSALVLVAAELGSRQLAEACQEVPARRFARAVPRAPALRAAARTLAPLFGIALVIALPWFARNALTYGATDLLGWARHDAVVAGQPTTAAWITQYGLRNTVFDFFAISFKSFWAQFGWMGVLVDDRIYTFLFLLTATASLGALLWGARLVRERRTFSGESKWTWLLLGLMLLLVAAAHVYYNLKFVQPQGRYLFPALIPIAAFWAAGLEELLNARYSRWLFALLYVIMLGVDYVSLVWYIVPQLSR